MTFIITVLICLLWINSGRQLRPTQPLAHCLPVGNVFLVNFFSPRNKIIVSDKSYLFHIPLEFIGSVLYDFPVCRYCCQNSACKTGHKTLSVALEGTEQKRKFSTNGSNRIFKNFPLFKHPQDNSIFHML